MRFFIQKRKNNLLLLLLSKIQQFIFGFANLLYYRKTLFIMNILFARRITSSLYPKITHKISVEKIDMQTTNKTWSSFFNNIKRFFNFKIILGFAFVIYCTESVYKNLFLNTKNIKTVAANAFSSSTEIGKVLKSTKNQQFDIRQKALSAEHQKVLLPRPSASLFHTITRIFRFVFRLIELACIFMPTFFTFPFYFTPWKNIFFKSLLWSISKSGIVFIKGSQVLSHQSDMIGKQISQQFEKLRQQNLQHSFAETKRIIKQNYKKQIQELFEQFNPKPIASGSVGQVYRAKFKGNKVAVKVRHPNLQQTIQRDITLIFAISEFLGKFSSKFLLPVQKYSFQKTLQDQFFFSLQKNNLDRFNALFVQNQNVSFPKAYDQSCDEVLIQQFIQSVPISYFLKESGNSSTQRAKKFYKEADRTFNKIVARLGSNAFFQMLIKHNFVHADSHGGNILVSVQDEDPSFFRQLCKFHPLDYLKKKIIQTFFLPQNMKQLYYQNERQIIQSRNYQRQHKKRVRITLIDLGMVVQLEMFDKQYFINFVKQVILGNSQQCAKMIYYISTKNNKFIAQRPQSFKSNSFFNMMAPYLGVNKTIELPQLSNLQYPAYYEELKTVFKTIHGNASSLMDLRGLDILRGMLMCTQNHGMKLDGKFTTLLGNMLTLQSIGHHLDARVNMLGCSIPYFV